MLHKTAWVSIWRNIAAGRSLRQTITSPSISIARTMSTQTAVPITATPAAGQLVEHNGKTYEAIREGQAYILIPPNTQKHVDPQAKTKDSEKPQSVFYNPIQQFNRDLSVLSIKAFGEDWMQRKKAKNEKNREKNNNRRAKKRKAGEVNGEEGGVKWRKSEDGSPKAVRGNEGQEHTEEGATKAEATKENGTTQTVPENAQEQREEQQNGHAEKPAGPRFRILDALSATGLRALRYAKEIPFVSAVVANDMNPNAIKSMEMNVQHNDLTSYITPNLGDAIGHMYSVAYPPSNSHGPTHVSHKYDVIDLDPYGTAAPFIDGALQALNDGGLLCVTCTDSGVFASTGYCEKTFSLYGGMPAKGPYMHEAGLRLIIGSIASAAAKYGIAIEPLLSLSIDFYARAFIRVRKSPADVKFLAGKTMLVYACDSGCGAFTTNMLGRNTKQTSKNGTPWYKHSIAAAPISDRLCEHCGTKTHIAGPMWGGPIHNAAFVSKILEDIETADPEIYQTLPRVEGMLSTALDELLVNEEVVKFTPTSKRSSTDEIIPLTPPETIDSHPFFINPSALSKVIHCVAPSDSAIKGALRHAGYICTRSHCQPGSIKTNAPWIVIWEVMREWVRQKQPIKEGALRETTAGFRIMQKARKMEETSNGAAEPAGEEGSKDDTPEIVTEGGVKPATPGAVDVSKMKVVFDEVLGKDKPGKKVVRYQQNPRENWGPMTKAKGSA